MNYFKLFNLIGFQIGWWSCVLGVKNGFPYLGPLVMIIFLAVHYIFHPGNRIIELRLILSFALIGTLADSVLALSGVLDYLGSYSSSFAPFWITAMWGGFTSTVNHSMDWLKNRIVLQIISGVVFGPLAYITGKKFDAIVFNLSISYTFLIIALVYGFSLPLVYYLNKRLGLD